MTSVPSIDPVEAVHDWTKPPFLRRVCIRGYKSIQFCDVRLDPLTILVGRNAAGKSNFLDALAFLRDTMLVGVPEAVQQHGGISGVLCRTGSPESITIEVHAGLEAPPPLGIPATASGSICSYDIVYRLRVPIEGHILKNVDEYILTSCPERNWGVGLTVRDRRVTQTNGSAIAPVDQQSPETSSRWSLNFLGNPPFPHFEGAIRNMGFYNFHPEAIRQLQKPLLGVLLKKDGSNLASVIGGLEEIDADSVQRVREYLSTIAPEVQSFDLARYGEYETVRFRLRPSSDEAPLEFDAASMSDGTLRALGTLMAAFQVVLPHRHPSVVGIEEPEAALHPAAMRALVDALDDATQWTQILLTTHSADLLSGRDVNPGQVLVVRNRSGTTQITPLDPASREIIEKELYSLADLQRMDKLDLDEADLRRQARLSEEGA